MIRIVQQLCPQRHCLMAIAYDPARDSADVALGSLQAAIKALHLNTWCGICGSSQLHFEDCATKFATMEEALPALRQNEDDCIKTRLALDAAGVTHDTLPSETAEFLRRATKGLTKAFGHDG